MKLSKDTTKLVIDSVRRNILPTKVRNASNEEVSAYYLDDVTVSFNLKNSKEVFSGISFEMFGKDFYVINTLEVLVLDSEGVEEDYFVVDDKDFVQVVENFFTWRMSALNIMKI